MSGQIVGATVVSAPKQRNTDAKKAECIPAPWKANPAKLAQKTRCALDNQVVRPSPPRMDRRASTLRYQASAKKSHVCINRHHGLVRTWIATDAARHDGAQLPGLLSKVNTEGDFWADTAYCPKQNEAHLAADELVSRIHCKKLPGKLMARNVARANGRKSKVRAAFKHVFVRQKGPMALVVRTIGLFADQSEDGNA